MKKQVLFYSAGLLLLLSSCGNQEKKNDGENTGSKTRINEKADRYEADSLASVYYDALLDQDSTLLQQCFAKELLADIPELLGIMADRNNEWGELEKITFTSTETRCTTDTCIYRIQVSTLYEYNESNDLLEITKTGTTPLITSYSFDDQLVTDCSDRKMLEIQPLLAKTAENLANKNDAKLGEWIEGKETNMADFRKSVLDLRNEFFPGELPHNLKAVYQNGYIRQYCGSKSGNNGFITYKVALGDTSERYITFFLETYEEETEPDIYSVLYSYYDGYNQKKDVDMAKKLGREVFYMIDKLDYKAFYNALHPKAREGLGVDQKSQEKLKNMLADYKSMGKLQGFEKVITQSIKENGRDEVRYVVIARLKDDENDEQLLEMSFKTNDQNGLISLFVLEPM